MNFETRVLYGRKLLGDINEDDRLREVMVLPDARIIEYETFYDHRGWFSEGYRHEALGEVLGASVVQMNMSKTARSIFRGMHYQYAPHMGKLITCLHGRLIDYIVDLRPQSPSYLYGAFATLAPEIKRSVWCPPGFAHGFLSLEDETVACYLCTGEYNKAGEGAVNPQCVELWIPSLPNISMSDKDANAEYICGDVAFTEKMLERFGDLAIEGMR